MQNIHPKIRANALSSYLFITINWAFLVVKDNPYIANDFVRSHTKTALTIHILIWLNLLIFVGYDALPYFSLLWYSIGDMIAISLCLMWTATMILWAYKAHKGQYFSLKKWNPLNTPQQFIDINNDAHINEKDSLTLILQHIPFIGSYLYGKHQHIKTIDNIAKLNIWMTIMILVIYINGNNSLASLIFLLYLIYIAFVGVNLITTHTLISIKSSFLLSPAQLRIIVITSIVYIKTYFSSQSFVPFVELKDTITKDQQAKKQEQEQRLQKIPKKDFFQAYRVHIYGYLILTGFIVCIMLGILSQRWIWFIILWAVSIAWQRKQQLSYTLPFIHDICMLAIWAVQYIKNIWSRTRDLHNKEQNKSIKID